MSNPVTHPIVSIIVPVYNVSGYLEECVNSLIDQSFTNIEIILVDDGSTDNSGKLCDRFALLDDRINVIHQKNHGLSGARNTGIRVAHGSQLMFMDSDDIADSGLVEYLYGLVETNSKYIGICDFAHFIDGDSPKFTKSTEVNQFYPEAAITELLYQHSFLAAAPGKIFPRNIFDKIQFPEGMIFEDNAVMYKLIDQSEGVVYGPSELVGYRHRSSSITNKHFSQDDLDILTIANQINEYFRYRNHSLVQASKVFEINAMMRIYVTATDEFDDVIKSCGAQIRHDSWQILTDKEARFKLKASIILFLVSRKLLIFIHSKVDRWA